MAITTSAEEQAVPWRVTVTIAAGRMTGDVPTSAVSIDLEVPSSQTRDLDGEVRALVGQAYVPHTYSYSGGYTSWGGASNPGLDIVLFVTEHAWDAAFGLAVSTLITSLARRFNGINRDRHLPLERDEAVMRARWFVVSRLRQADRYPQGDLDKLRLTSEEYDAVTDRWSLEFLSPAGDQFKVDLGTDEGLPWVMRLRRTIATGGTDREHESSLIASAED